MDQQQASTLQALLEPVVSGLGYEFVGLELVPQRGQLLLRVYIDSIGGINIGDCETVSHQVSGVLDVEEAIPGRYILEVSSPGLDRPLFSEEHYRRFIGKKVSVKTLAPIDGRRRFTGIIDGVDAGSVVIADDGTKFVIALAQIDKARLVPEFD